MQVMDIHRTVVPTGTSSTPLDRAAHLLRTALPSGWTVEVADTEPSRPTLLIQPVD